MYQIFTFIQQHPKVVKIHHQDMELLWLQHQQQKSILSYSVTNATTILSVDKNEEDDDDNDERGRKRKREAELPSRKQKKVKATPEESGKHAAKGLCEEISRGGFVDSSHQPIVLLLMALASEDISKVRFGRLTPFTISFLRFLKESFGIVFKIVPADEENVLLSCRGQGLQNIAKRIA